MSTSGSEWVKWDLHVHTKASYDYKDKSKSYQDIADHINKSDLDGVAITDHWTIEGCYALKPLIKKKCLLPAIEVRVDKSSKTKVLGSAGKSSGTGLLHAIIIFPEETKQKDIEIKFLHKIELCEEKHKYITREDIIKKGKEIRAGLTDEESFKIGCEQVYVDYKKVVECAKSLNGIVCLTYDSYGGFESIDPINDSAFKSNLVRDCDFVETSKEEIRKAFYEHPDILKSCGKKVPCFKGSDAHEISEIGCKYIWVKANPTFEGLRQAIYFPKERISFSENKPTYSFPWITSIEFEKLEAGHPLSHFDKKIEFNQNLTCIIGQPSIGKSTLAEALTFAFNSHSGEQIGEEKTKIQNIVDKNPKLLITVKVKRGTVTNVLERSIKGVFGGDIAHDEFPVTYINQGHIDKAARNSGSVSALIKKMMDTTELDLISNEISKIQKKLIIGRDKYLKKYQLQAEKSELVSKLNGVKKTFDISDSKEYKALDKKRKELQEREQKIQTFEENLSQTGALIQEFETDIKSTPLTQSEFKTLFPSLKALKIPDIQSFLTETIKSISDIESKIKTSSELTELDKQKKKNGIDIKELFKKENINFTETLLANTQKEQGKLEKLLRGKEVDIQECENSKAAYDEQLKALTKQVEHWNAQNTLCVARFNEGLENVSVRYDHPDKKVWLIKVLTEDVKSAWDTYSTQEQKTRKFKRPSEDDIEAFITEIKTSKKFTLDEAISYFLTCLDKGEIPLDSQLEYAKWLFGEYSPVIKDFLKLRLREYYEKGEHQIYIGDKNISKEGLSFTERCGALIEVILEKGNTPLIMDQVEENLGSTYITNRLKNKILSKKFDRQIILISHNPNTVVLSDSDLIQSFDRKDNSSDKIDILSGAIEYPGIKDSVCTIIEGGAEAFDQRAKTYKHE